ncbi:MAG TPA: TGS domain-containing protein [Candidatus Marinimicrobia bacterium]|nr:TGS domain-containing protein [Candidatus Neomarinimicrobiota bacterium]
MPANLPPEYFAAEEKFRSAESTSAKIHCLEELISTVPKHKGTDHLRAELRRKLSRLKSEQHKKKNVGRHESDFQIEKEGSGRIVVTGPTNVGKSSLVAQLTRATPKISDSPYTTWNPLPGMLNVQNVQLQLIDTPPLNPDFSQPELFDLIRTADLILLMLDIQDFPIQQLADSIALLTKHHITPEFLKNQPENSNASLSIPTLIVVNKVDNRSFMDDFNAFCELEDIELPVLPISVLSQNNLDFLGSRCLEMMRLIRIFSKPPGKEPDLTQPYVLKSGATVTDFAGKVHRDFVQNLKTARVWGSGVYDGQMVGRDHLLNDGDIVELHI